ncbi:MAG: OmpA family protein [Elusimicrobiales bacterium]|jgi:outer membrane protein OmpA-like peptidoglycan-associated protein|nr:OmpA family protein [Elusimicrobiales bacterium]
MNMNKYLTIVILGLGMMTAACSSAQKANEDVNEAAVAAQENVDEQAQAANEAVAEAPAPVQEEVQAATEKADEAVAEGVTIMEEAVSKIPTKLVVNFDTDSAVITGKYYPLVKVFLSNLKQDNLVKIKIDGYTDDVGTDEYNAKLAKARAEAVADYLVDNGISRNIIVTTGHSKTDYAADNDTEEGRAKNRRVEITLEK